MLATTVVSSLAVIAIVTQDRVALRAAPRESAAQQAVLWAGDSLEIRGEKGDYLQVYDHRHERAGFVRAPQVRVQSLDAKSAPELRAVVRFVQDTPGAEALGIAYVAAYLKAAPAASIDAEIFSALGSMSERLAQRVSNSKSGSAADASAAQVEVATAYGVSMVNVQIQISAQMQMKVCYDGEAYRRVMAMPATETQKANAALALTRHDCISTDMHPIEKFAYDNWRAEILDRVDNRDLSLTLKNRLQIRKAGVWASLAYQRARRSETPPAAILEAGERAVDALASVNKSELAESDALAYNDAALRVGASRWAAQMDTTANKSSASALRVALTAGTPGETCVHLVDAHHDVKNPLAKRCTYAIVWAQSMKKNRNETAIAMAVQALDTWRELWMFRKSKEGWTIDVLPPALDTVSLGYIEHAGWIPNSTSFLAARETRSDGLTKTSFEQISMTTLETQKRADKPGNLNNFYRWQDPLWKGQTVSVR